VKIAAARARRAPGVLAVFTGSDVAHLGTMKMLLKRKRPDGSPMFARRTAVSTRERARYVGDPVAMVVAETLAQAEDAADAVRIDYEPLPSVTSTAEAVGGPRSGRMPRQRSNVHEVGDRGGDRGRPSPGPHGVRRRTSSPGHANNEARAPSGRGPGRAALHAARDVQYHTACGRARHQYPQCPRAPDPRDRRRRRRRLRHEGLASIPSIAGPVGGAPAGRPVKWRCERREAIPPTSTRATT